MCTGYRIALASVLALVFSLCAIALILAGKEDHVPKPLQAVMFIVGLPMALLSLGSRVFPAANRLVSGWAGFVLLQFAYCYALVLLVEALFKRFRRRAARPSHQ